MYPNLLSRKDKIRRSLLERAKKMWNISSLSEMDPLVKLLLDALAFELSKVGQSITASNNKILEELASLLVPSEQFLAFPAHAIMSGIPMESDMTLMPKSQFYLPNGLKEATFDKIPGDLYFSTIEEVPLINAQVKWMVEEKTAWQFYEGVHKEEVTTTRITKKFPDREVWIGIEQGSFFNIVHGLEFFLDLKEETEVNNIFRFNQQIQFDLLQADGTFLRLDIAPPSKPAKPSLERKNIEEAIKSYYANKFVYVSSSKGRLKLSKELRVPYPKIFETYFSEEALEFFTTPCIWIKIQFPEKFTRKIIQKLKIFINCFIVINKRLLKFQHNLRRSGTILPLTNLAGEQFLSVGEITDQRDLTYHAVPNPNISQKTGIYKVYHGRLESFDLRKGLLMLEQLVYKVREEGNAFSSLAQDTVLLHLKELYEKLQLLDNKVKREKENYEDNTFNSYVQTFPHEFSTWLEYEYWATNAELANGLEVGTEMQQYRIKDPLEPNHIRLITSTIGGRSALEAGEKVKSLRHLVLSKNRLVSEADIRNYIEKEIGHLVTKVLIQPGVRIPPNKKQGLIRVTEIILFPKRNTHTSNEWNIISAGLEHQIRTKAIRGQQYYVSVEAVHSAHNN